MPREGEWVGGLVGGWARNDVELSRFVLWRDRKTIRGLGVRIFRSNDIIYPGASSVAEAVSDKKMSRRTTIKRMLP